MSKLEVIEFVEHADAHWKSGKCPWCRGLLLKTGEQKGAIQAEYICLSNCSKQATT